MDLHSTPSYTRCSAIFSDSRLTKTRDWCLASPINKSILIVRAFQQHAGAQEYT